MSKISFKEKANETAVGGLRSALEGAADGVVLMDEQGRVTTWNSKFLNIWGLSEKLVSLLNIQKIRELMAQQLKDSGRYLARIAEIEASEGKSFDLLELIDGRLVERYSEVVSPGGRGAGRVWSFRIVTERQHPNLVADRLAAIVDNSDDAIIGKDLNGIITSWNRGAERIFGYSVEEMIGTSITRLIPLERQAEEEEILALIKRGKRYNHFDTIRVTKDGRQLHISLTVSPIKDANGNVVGASKIARDVTERKLAEKALEEAHELADATNNERRRVLEIERAAKSEAERVNHMKDDFLATLSHELRTPLNAVLGWAATLRISSPRTGQLAEGLEAIERNARAQAQMIADLLDMSRIVSGKMRMDVEHIDLPTILTEAIETVRSTASAKGVRLQSVINPLNAPISGDPNRLQQVFWNLLNNAIKFTPKAGLIQVLLERVSSNVEISIIDTGEGISPEFLPYIFNRFEQADASTTRRHSGLGLGLAIVKCLVELHAGQIQAKSGGAGKGATFIVSLPLTVVHPLLVELEREHPHSKLRDLPSPPEISLKDVNVLVIDDQQDACNLLKLLLKSAGASVHLAQSADKGIEQLITEPVDVLICDVGMPDVDGYAFIRRVRTLDDPQKSGVAAVALTAYARLEDRTKAILAGFQHHLLKPVEPAELLAVVHSLATHSSRR